MAEKILNLTMLWVADEIAQILDTEQLFFEYKDFFNSSLHKELMGYVLSNIPNVYAVINDEDNFWEQCNHTYCSGERRLQIEAVIHQGLLEIVQHKRNWLEQQICKHTKLDFYSST
jgi:hypothetical protein